MKNKIFKTNDSYIGLILRATLAIVVFPHGAQKLFGWFGGYGFSGTMGFFTVLGIIFHSLFGICNQQDVTE